MKYITSPVKKFPGKVGLKEPIPYPEFVEWEKAIFNAKESQAEKEQMMWGGVAALVEEWGIENFDVKAPCATPRKSVVQLLSWLVKEIGIVINGEPDPNA